MVMREEVRHVSWTTKRLSAETPAATKSVQRVNADNWCCPKSTVTSNSIIGNERNICMGCEYGRRQAACVSSEKGQESWCERRGCMHAHL